MSCLSGSDQRPHLLCYPCPAAISLVQRDAMERDTGQRYTQFVGSQFTLTTLIPYVSSSYAAGAEKLYRWNKRAPAAFSFAPESPFLPVRQAGV